MNKHSDFIKAIVTNGIRENISVEHTASMIVSVLSVVDKDFPKTTDGIDDVIETAMEMMDDKNSGINHETIRKWLSDVVQL